MNRSVAALSERERDTLRLLLRGHDAKSIARHLGLSVHTVNERLRDARRKLDVPSSREAARILAEAEEPNSLRDKQFRVGSGALKADRQRRGGVRLAWLGGGMLIMSLIIAAAVLASGFHGTSSAATSSAPKVIATNPKPDSTIAPGQFVLSVTYDRRMGDGYSFVRISPDTFPDCQSGPPRQSQDGRTFALNCTASAGIRYEVWFNREPYMNFHSTEGAAALPYQLVFRVRANSSAAAPVADAAAVMSAPADQVALKWLHLRDRGDWAEAWREAGAEVKSAISEAGFASAAGNVRGQLGPVLSRKLLSVNAFGSAPGLPQGDYVNVQFRTDFAHKKDVTERVTLSREEAEWKVIGYHIL